MIEKAQNIVEQFYNSFKPTACLLLVYSNKSDLQAVEFGEMKDDLKSKLEKLFNETNDFEKSFLSDGDIGKLDEKLKSYKRSIKKISNKLNNEEIYFLLLNEDDSLEKEFQFTSEILQGIFNEEPDELKLVKEELLKLQDEKRMFIEKSDELIFNLDKNGYIVLINDKGSKTLGYKNERIIGRHFLEFVAESKKSELALDFQKVLSSENVVEFRTKLHDRYGNDIDYKIYARSLKADGKIDGLIGCGKNVTEMQKDEEKVQRLNSKLIEAERLVEIERDRAQQQISVLEELNRLKNEFISNVSHELRTPLASIVGFAETITSDPDLPKEMIQEFSGIIHEEGKRLAKLINEILDFSKLEAGSDVLNIENVDIVDLLFEIVSGFQKAADDKKITINNEIPEAEILLKADRDRIKQALGNLVLNAIKFTKEGGRVTIIAREFLNEVEIIVNDTGIGIPKDEIPNLFQKFKKVNRPGEQIPGAGFGLVVVKQIIDLHKGMIRVKSEKNKGSSFIVRLPKVLK